MLGAVPCYLSIYLCIYLVEWWLVRAMDMLGAVPCYLSIYIPSRMMTGKSNGHARSLFLYNTQDLNLTQVKWTSFWKSEKNHLKFPIIGIRLNSEDENSLRSIQ